MFLLYSGIVGFGCGRGDDGSTRHPLPEALRDIRRGATSVLSSDTLPPATMHKVDAGRWTDMRKRILAARPGPILGAFGGEGLDVLGDLVNVTLDDAGRTYVLDSMNGRVVVFDADGRAVSAFGRVGDGPMEFRAPRDLVANRDTIIVAQTGLLKVFVRTDREYLLQSQVRLGGSLNSLCFSKGRVFGSVRRQPEGVVAEYGLAASNRRQSFGMGYTVGWQYAQQTLSTGFVACGDNLGFVVYGHERLPALDAYAFDGRRVWSAIIADYQQGYWTETRDGWMVSPRPPRESLTSLVMTSADFVIASYYREDQDGNVTTRVYLLDARTGAGGLLEQTDRGDREILAISSERYVTYVRGTYPRLRIWHVEEQ